LITDTVESILKPALGGLFRVEGTLVARRGLAFGDCPPRGSPALLLTLFILDRVVISALHFTLVRFELIVYVFCRYLQILVARDKMRVALLTFASDRIGWLDDLQIPLAHVPIVSSFELSRSSFL
jgi:hypothetical protein